MKHKETSEDCYCLKLANGQRWHITSTEEEKPWVEKLASILGLRKCLPAKYPRIIFVKRRSGNKAFSKTIYDLNSNIETDLPETGWIAHLLGFLKIWSHPDVPDVICEMRDARDTNLDAFRMGEAMIPIYQRAQNLGGLPMHAALIEWKGTGVLISAKGGTGKSTCCRRLPRPWYPICDDHTLIVQDEQKRYSVHPFPTWKDYSTGLCETNWNVEKSFPLFGIFFLERGEVDGTFSVGQGRGAALINYSATQVFQYKWRDLSGEHERILRRKIFENACEIARKIPTYTLRASLTGRFWEKIEEVLP
jgi:SynChlorMet cassette protein ScmC